MESVLGPLLVALLVLFLRRLTDVTRVRDAIVGQIHYTEGVQAHWRETTLGEHGELLLEGLPFEAGQPVEVLVISKSAGSATAEGRVLRDSVLEYHEPLDPVASEDWDALQ